MIEEVSKSQIDRLGERLRKRNITENDLRLWISIDFRLHDSLRARVIQKTSKRDRDFSRGNGDEEMIFLIEYDRDRGKLITFTSYQDRGKKECRKRTPRIGTRSQSS